MLAYRSANNLSDEVSQVLTEMSGDVEGEDEDQLRLSDVLARLNSGRPRHIRLSRADLESVLLELEKENKLMYVQDSDEPFIMLV